MPFSANNPADVINVALIEIGWKKTIGDPYDGSAAGQAALTVYGETRDELLRDLNPGFAMRNVAMTLLKSAPVGGYVPGVTPWDPTTNPPVGYLYEYAYPNDCLKVRAVKPTPIFFPNVDPVYNPFSIDNDSAYSPPQRVILCNVADALLVYTGRVTDPTTMSVDFLDAFIDRLGRRLAPVLTGLDAAKLEVAEEQNSKSMAQLEQG